MYLYTSTQMIILLIIINFMIYHEYCDSYPNLLVGITFNILGFSYLCCHYSFPESNFIIIYILWAFILFSIFNICFVLKYEFEKYFIGKLGKSVYKKFFNILIIGIFVIFVSAFTRSFLLLFISAAFFIVALILGLYIQKQISQLQNKYPENLYLISNMPFKGKYISIREKINNLPFSDPVTQEELDENYKFSVQQLNDTIKKLVIGETYYIDTNEKVLNILKNREKRRQLKILNTETAPGNIFNKRTFKKIFGNNFDNSKYKYNFSYVYTIKFEFLKH